MLYALAAVCGFVVGLVWFRLPKLGRTDNVVHIDSARRYDLTKSGDL